MVGKGLLGVFGLSVLFGTNVLACSGGSDPSPAPSSPAASTPDAPSAPEQPAAAPPAAAETPAPVPAPEPVKLAPEKLGARLALWLRADQGVTASGDAVTTWKDSSGNGNDATTMGMPPVTLAAAGVGGKPSVHFPGGTAYLNVPDSASLHFGTDDVSAYVVFAHASNLAPYSRIVMAKTAVASPFQGLGFYANINNTYGLGAAVRFPSPLVTLDSNDAAVFGQMKPMLVVAKRTGGGELGLLSGAKTSTANALYNQAPVDLTNQAALRIGGQGGQDQALLGDIAEIVLVHGAMTSAESDDVSAYLTAKYGL